MTELNPTCQQIQDQIDQMSQRQLRLAADQGPVCDHVQSCPACKGYLAKALDLASQLDQWEVPQPKRNIVAAVMAELAELEPDQRPGRIGLGVRLLSLARYRLQVPAAAAILITGLLAASIALNLKGHRLPSGPGPVVRVDRMPREAQVTTPPVIPVKVNNADQVRTFLADPRLTSGPMIVILGMPPVLSGEGSPGPVRLKSDKPPL